jgi:hypothetical protein
MLNSEFRMQNSEGGKSEMTGRLALRRWLALPALCILHSALLLSLTGCGAKAKAQTLPDGPPLAVPIAPPHEIVIEQIAQAPPEPEPERVPEVVATKPEPPTERRPTRPPAPRSETTPPPNLPAAAAQPAPSEAPVVRATPAAAGADEKKVRELLNRANSDLAKRVDYQKLSDEGKQQYNEAKRFSEQAEQAIKDRNFPYALSLAEKAARLAAELIR